jgi:hypothetical protein
MVLALPGPVFAQAAKQAPASAPSDAKVLLDNPSVRVVQMNVMPGTKLPADARPGRLLYMLSEGALVFVEDGKRPYEMIFKAGEAVWVPAQARVAEVSGDQEVRALIVEVKQTPPAAAKTRARGRRGAKKR